MRGALYDSRTRFLTRLLIVIIRQALSVTPPAAPAEPHEADLSPSQHESEYKGKDKPGMASATQVAQGPGKLTVEASIDRDNMQVRGNSHGQLEG